jgi:hypothetical protein
MVRSHVAVTRSIVGTIVLACLAGGCVEKGRSLLLVDVAASPLPATHVQVVATMAGSGRRWSVERPWTGSSLSLGVYLPADVSGDVAASACGYDDTGMLVASGAGMPATVVVSPGTQSAEVAVMLVAGAVGAANCHCTDGHGDAGSAGGGCIAVTQAADLPAVNLTEEGKIDWAHWGYPNESGFNHKVNGGGRIKDLTPGAAGMGGSATFTWTDGSPTPSSPPGGVMNGVYVNYTTGASNAWSWTVEAAPTLRTLRLYIGTGNSGGNVTITNLHLHLTDDSATADYEIKSDSGPIDVLFSAGSPDQSLEVTWTWTSAAIGDSIYLRAATLF